MRITAPDPAARVDIAGIDLADPNLYIDGDAHLAWQTLRAERPLHWTTRPDGLGFWSVTRRDDVVRVLREHETFTSERGTSLALLGTEDPAGGKMMVVTDPPRHATIREPLSKPLSAHAVPDYAAWIRDFVRKAIEPAWECKTFDAAATFSRLPVATVVHLMNLPAKDTDTLIRILYSSAASGDPAFQTGSQAATLRRSHYEFVDYFDDAIRKRRGALSDDLLSQLLTIEIDGAPMNDEVAIVNCYSLLLGAAVTTSQSVNAALIAIAEQGGGEGRWSADIPVATAVEETLRWSSPSLHFLRYACHDVMLHDQRIKAGDAVAAWIPSANRDETVFADTYRFDPYRTPNRHAAFGAGPHRCVGISLARLMLRVVFEEFFARLTTFELAAPPEHIVSNEIAGVRSLPLRLGPARVL